MPQQQIVRQRGVAVVRKRVQQIRCAEESGRQMAGLAHQLRKLRGHALLLIRVQETEHQRLGASGLCVFRDASVAHEARAERGKRLVEAALVNRHIQSQQLAGADQKRIGVQEISVLQIGFGRRMVAVQIEPVGKVFAAQPQAVRTVRAHIIDPAAHRGVLLNQHLAVAVGLVDLPRADDRRVRPAARAAVHPLLGRDHMLDFTVGRLADGQIAQPFFEKSADVVNIGRGACEHLRVTRPAQPLVALRTVGRHVHKVAALTPDDVFKQAVDVRVGALEPARAFHIGKNDDCCKVFRLYFLRPVVQTQILESVKCKFRLVCAARPVAVIGDRRLGRAQILHIDVAVLVEHLEAADRSLVSRFAANGKLHIADQVLAEVDHRVALRRCKNALHRQTQLFAHRLVLLRDKQVGRVVDRAVVIMADGILIRALAVTAQYAHRGHGVRIAERGVECFAVVHVGHTRAGLAAQPRLVRDDRLLCAVGKNDVQRSDKRRLRIVHLTLKPTVPRMHPPALGHAGADTVVRAQHLRHVVRLELHAGTVIRPAGRENLVADACAVDLQHIHADRRRLQRRGLYGLVQVKCFFQRVNGFSLICGRSDPAGVINHIHQKYLSFNKYFVNYSKPTFFCQ